MQVCFGIGCAVAIQADYDVADYAVYSIASSADELFQQLSLQVSNVIIAQGCKCLPVQLKQLSYYLTTALKCHGNYLL